MGESDIKNKTNKQKKKKKNKNRPSIRDNSSSKIMKYKMNYK